MAQVYSLQIFRAKDVVWDAGPLQSKSPTLYVAIHTSLKTEKTRVGKTSTAKRGREPTWENAIFPLPVGPSDSIIVGLYHDTSIPLRKDRCLGEICIGLDKLLEVYVGENGAPLDLMLKGTVSGTVIIRLIRSLTDELIEITAHDVEKMKQTAETRASEMADTVADLTLNQGVESIIDKLNLIITLGDEIAKIHPYAHAAWKILTSVYQVVRKQQETDDQLLKLVKTMVDVYSFVQEIQKLRDTIKRLEATVLAITKETVECAIFIHEYTRLGFLGRLVENAFSETKEIIEDLSKTLREMKESLKADISLQGVFTSAKLEEKIDFLVQSDTLRSLSPVDFNAASRQECIPGTRRDILSQIIDWLVMPSDAGNILWLHGVAGAGKSTISTTVSQYFRSLKRLGGFLFFQRDNPTRSSPDTVIRTIAAGLATHNQHIRLAIFEAIKSDPSLVAAPILTQFEKLLLEPLTTTVSHDRIPGPIIVILDALDECGQSPEERRLLVSLIAMHFPRLPAVFRFLITSRPDSDIAGPFRAQPLIKPLLLDIDTPKTQEDIFIYINTMMQGIRQRKNERQPHSLDSQWPGELAVQTLTDCAGGLFQWASLATRFIDSHYPTKNLETLLKSSERLTKDLDALYTVALRNSLDWADETFSHEVVLVLGALVFSRTPLMDVAMDPLLGLDRKVSSGVLGSLGCVLQWSSGQPARLLHASFSDYLIDRRRSGHLPWFLHSETHIKSITLGCFRVLKQELKFNICGLENSHVLNADVPRLSERISDSISPALSYASQHWAYHLHTTAPDQEILAELGDFMCTGLLYWLEVLSLLNQIPTARECIVIALDHTRSHNENVGNLLQDALKFVTAFAPLMSQSAPHIYISALPFAPRMSSLRRNFAPYFPHTVRFDGPLGGGWSTVLKILQGHTDYVECVAFSADGKQIISGAWDRTVRVWDAETGAAVGNPFKGHADKVIHVAMSPDGKQIISASPDTVQIQDYPTGGVIVIPFNSLRVIAVSPNGRYIVSGSEQFPQGNPARVETTLALWDSQTGHPIGPKIQCDVEAYSIAFSADGRHVVTGLQDRTIRVWNTETGHQVGPIIQCACKVYSVAFSPDGRQIGSGCSDSKVRVWDSVTGDLIGAPFKVPIEPTFAKTAAEFLQFVTFSPDGKWIVAACSCKVTILDVATGSLVGLLDGHTGVITSVAFSPDGGQIVSASGDKSLRVWDSSVVLPPPNGELFATGNTASLAFSPDGKWIVSGGYRDGIVRVRDSKTGASIVHPFEGSVEGGVHRIALSPDGSKIAVGCRDLSSGGYLVRVWHAETGTSTTVKAGGNGEYNWKHTWSGFMTFSPDGRHLTFRHEDDPTIRICSSDSWSIVAEGQMMPADGFVGMFSSNGESVICLGPGRRTDWNWKLGSLAHTQFADPQFEPQMVAFALAPNGKHIASGHPDETVKIWDEQTVDPIFTGLLSGHSAWVRSAVFSPDSQWIAVGTTDGVVQIWDHKAGAVVAGPFEGPAQSVTCIVFSPDGDYLASAAYDGSIRMWQVRNAEPSSGPWGNRPAFKDGWITLDAGSQRLIWVPPWLRDGLILPWMLFLNQTSPTTKLDLTDFVHGTEWEKCIDPKFREAL
ncbi:WD40-repeat-containing domain protein [Mycena crocata]|nr:WD40-repeat-containing domain protein [Mycena crocata]